jgi:predicted Zn-dependent peptidase
MTILTKTSAALALLGAVAGAQIPSHPDELSYPTLDFTPPAAEQYRHQLSNGVPVYVVPSHEFPLVDISFTFMGGAYLAPADQAGITSAMGSQMRRGGTTSVGADELDEQLAFLAANISTFAGGEQSGANLDCLKGNFDEAFGLFMDIVRQPGFDAEKLRIYKDQVLEGFKQRNDNPMGVAMPTMRRLAYGDDHYSTREATQASIEGITAESLGKLHGRIFHPGNLLVSVTGDVEVDEILDVLGAAFAGWESRPRNPNPPVPNHSIKPGLYHADTTQQDMPQGTTLIMGPGIQRDNPDAIALRIMNDILGGGGFTSRVTNRVRSDEGLAYTAMTRLQPQVWYRGLFFGFFQSKNRTVALATQIILEEIERIRNEPVTQAELDVAKNAMIEGFPQRFSSKQAILRQFVSDELTGRAADYWRTWRDRVAAVDAAAVQRVANEHLDPGSMAIFVVGDWDAIEGGDLEGRASMLEFFGGEVEHLPMLDPLTREPMESGDATGP